MSGIYIHIPFCKKACHYCDFHFSTSLKNVDKLMDSILLELELRRDYIEPNVETIYFGGGTPSIVSELWLSKVLQKIDTLFVVSNNAEITIEANPDDLTKDKLEALKKIGINRLSIGIQSFIESDLKLMNRSHNTEQATESVKLAQAVGFDNISIDLIYGLPDLSVEKWKGNVQKVIDLEVQHISSYCLTVEPKTALAHFVKSGKVIPQKDEVANQQFELLIEMLKNSEIEQYEISNFSKEGFESKHNSSYWKKQNYLGVGPSAHSFDGVSRQWNVSNNNIYIKNVNNKGVYFDKETLSEVDLYNEYIMTGLRTKWGVDVTVVNSSFSKDICLNFNNNVNNLLKHGYLFLSINCLVLTIKGKIFSDKVAVDLFFIE